MKPTKEQFDNFEKLFDYFNQKLFDNQLPNIILNFSRKSGTAGFFSPNNWQKINGDTTHEISINPNSFNNGKVYIIETLVHEMCHLWQEEFGDPGSKKSYNYHNKEWAGKMCSVGLIPSDTGLEGGKQTGTKMSDYMEKGGVLEDALNNMSDSLWYPFETLKVINIEDLRDALELEEDPVKVEELEEEIKNFEEAIEQAKKKHKSKYSCPNCEINVWGKAELNLKCLDCDQAMIESRPE